MLKTCTSWTFVCRRPARPACFEPSGPPCPPPSSVPRFERSTPLVFALVLASHRRHGSRWSVLCMVGSGAAGDMTTSPAARLGGGSTADGGASSSVPARDSASADDRDAPGGQPRSAVPSHPLLAIRVRRQGRNSAPNLLSTAPISESQIENPVRGPEWRIFTRPRPLATAAEHPTMARANS